MKPKDPLAAADVGHALGLLVHDLRNPAATLTANVDFLADAGVADDDSREALDDMRIALSELSRGLELVAWVARGLAGQEPVVATPGDVAASLAAAVRGFAKESSVSLTVHGDGPFVARGGASAPRVVETLLANAREHARGRPVTVDVRRDGAWVVVTTTDAGKAIAASLRERAFTLGGQSDVKGKAEGRYGRYLALAAVRMAMDGLDGSVEARGEDGAAVFELRFPAQG